MYVTISISRCPCVAKPRLGCTRSSFMTRSTPKSRRLTSLYSAKLKWNRDFSQLPLFHAGLLASLLGLPKYTGSGSETKRDSAETYSTFPVDMFKT